MSNEIYSEYVVKYWVEEKTQKQRIRLNQKYTFGAGNRSITGICSDQKKEAGAFFEVRTSEINSFKRAPKTQMINGHKVVAPRYDEPENSGDIAYWLNPTFREGIQSYNWESLNKSEREALMVNGYHTSKENIIAYANAHRENK